MTELTVLTRSHCL